MNAMFCALGSDAPRNGPGFGLCHFGRLRGKWLTMAIAAIMGCYMAAQTWLGYTTAPVWQEPAQLAAGLGWWQFHRHDMIRVNPPLVRQVAVAPIALFLRPTLDPNILDHSPLRRDEYFRAEQLLWDNADSVHLFFAIARFVCMFFGVIGAYFCCQMAKMCYGAYAGLTAVIVWCWSPYILGHASTIMTDVPAAGMGVATVCCFLRWLRKAEWLEAIVVGLLLGAAELCKFTLLIFYPLLPALWIAYRMPEWRTMKRRDWLRQGVMLIVAMAISIYVINCGYLFEGTLAPLDEFRFQTKMFTGHASLREIPSDGGNRFAGTWLGRVPVPLPADFVQGIDMQRYDFERGLPSYLRGEWADHGWWYYYVYALAIKMPLGTWCLVALAFVITGRDFGCENRSSFVSFVIPLAKNKRSEQLSSPTLVQKKGGNSVSWRDEMVVIVPGLALLIFVSSQTGFSVHSRYIIPSLPFLFVWTSKVGRVFEREMWERRESGRRLVAAFLVIIALTWSVGSSLSIYPHSLSYFNELAAVLPTAHDISYPKPLTKMHEDHSLLPRLKWGINIGPYNGPRHLLDSNIDWGQDLFYLKHWLDGHTDVKLDGLAYYGAYPATLMCIPETPNPPKGPEYEPFNRNEPRASCGPKPGWYALSVSYIYDPSHQYRYFLNFEPLATAGYSIYIYHITLNDANRVRKELGLPEIREKGEGKQEELNASGAAQSVEREEQHG